jgi:hypothetical protein
MKIITLLLHLLLFISCKKDTVNSATAWLDKKIELGTDTNGKIISVYSYQYDQKTVYLVNYEVKCCDNFTSQLFDNQGNSLCFPYGGVGGVGDKKCESFDLEKTNEKLYWKL